MKRSKSTEAACSGATSSDQIPSQSDDVDGSSGKTGKVESPAKAKDATEGSPSKTESVSGSPMEKDSANGMLKRVDNKCGSSGKHDESESIERTSSCGSITVSLEEEVKVEVIIQCAGYHIYCI